VIRRAGLSGPTLRASAKASGPAIGNNRESIITRDRTSERACTHGEGAGAPGIMETFSQGENAVLLWSQWPRLGFR
jgi:hypothetical protein